MQYGLERGQDEPSGFEKVDGLCGEPTVFDLSGVACGGGPYPDVDLSQDWPQIGEESGGEQVGRDPSLHLASSGGGWIDSHDGRD